MARALSRRGLRVVCFKAGPDYIDSAYLSAASGAPAGNLDTWLMGAAYIRRRVADAAQEADIVLIEGVRSLYDGADAVLDEGSTAHLAKVLEAPVLLAINAKSLARGIAAVAKGFASLDPDVDVRGVILNMIKGPVHEQKCRRALSVLAGMPVFGSVCRDESLHTPMRHLGLLTVAENPDVMAHLDLLADIVEAHIDLDGVLACAATAPPLDGSSEDRPVHRHEGIRLGVACDAAFSFYYPELYAMARAWGADVHFVSPLTDRRLSPAIDCLFIGGGYPECHAGILSGNGHFMRDLASRIGDGLPVYAECAGLLYLGRSLSGTDGARHCMVGALDTDAVMCDRCQSVSYAVLKSRMPTVISANGELLRGHEFHYSAVSYDDARFAHDVLRGKGIDGCHDGIVQHNTLAQYCHIHFGSQEPRLSALLAHGATYRRT
jgi:cobyrinic acid a,c-diamide synthase